MGPQGLKLQGSHQRRLDRPEDEREQFQMSKGCQHLPVQTLRGLV